MRNTIKTITIDGVTKSIAEWAKTSGISPATIHVRLARGWDPQDAVTVEPKLQPDVTKDNAERLLNEMEVDQLPFTLRVLLPSPYRGNQPGAYIRRHHRIKFDHWFDTVYSPNHQKKHAA